MLVFLMEIPEKLNFYNKSFKSLTKYVSLAQNLGGSSHLPTAFLLT